MNPIIIANTRCHSKITSVRVAAITAGATLLLLAGATTSCSTTKGFGKDVERTGEHIQHAATH